MNAFCPKSDFSLLIRMALLHVGVCLFFPVTLCSWKLVWCVLKTLLVMWCLFSLSCGVTFVILRLTYFNQAEEQSRIGRP